jgi:hypothetical protein
MERDAVKRWPPCRRSKRRRSSLPLRGVKRPPRSRNGKHRWRVRNAEADPVPASSSGSRRSLAVAPPPWKGDCANAWPPSGSSHLTATETSLDRSPGSRMRRAPMFSSESWEPFGSMFVSGRIRDSRSAQRSHHPSRSGGRRGSSRGSASRTSMGRGSETAGHVKDVKRPRSFGNGSCRSSSSGLPDPGRRRSGT